MVENEPTNDLPLLIMDFFRAPFLPRANVKIVRWIYTQRLVGQTVRLLRVDQRPI